MRTLEEAKEYCDKNLRLTLEDFEKRRLSVLPHYGRTSKRIFWTGVLVFALELYASPWLYGGDRIAFSPMVTILVLLGTLAVKGHRTTGRFNAFRLEFKLKILLPLIRFMAPDLKYSEKGLISPELIRSCGLFLPLPTAFRVMVEDAFEGATDGLEVSFAQVTVSYIQPSRDKDSSSNEVSNTGLFFSTDFHKNFKSRTLLRSGDIEGLIGAYMKSVLSRGADTLLKTAELLRDGPDRMGTDALKAQIAAWGEEVRMENPEFEKIFEVRSEDPVEARYILSTSLVQRILDYQRWAQCPLEMAFVGSKMHAFLRVGDLFDLRREDLFKPLLDFQVIAKRLRDLVVVGSLAKELNQSTRIWSKR